MLEELISKARAKLDKEVLSIEKRSDLTDDQKVSRIITLFSTVCAAIAVQPIPFADIFILTPLQAYMGVRIAAIRGVPLSEHQATDLIKEIMGVIGMGMLAQQLGIAAAKLFFPIFGGIATVPVVFGLTYAIGKVMDLYLVAKASGQSVSKEKIKEAWKKAKTEGQAEGKRREKDIKRDGLA